MTKPKLAKPRSHTHGMQQYSQRSIKQHARRQLIESTIWLHIQEYDCLAFTIRAISFVNATVYFQDIMFVKHLDEYVSSCEISLTPRHRIIPLTSPSFDDCHLTLQKLRKTAPYFFKHEKDDQIYSYDKRPTHGVKMSTWKSDPG